MEETIALTLRRLEMPDDADLFRTAYHWDDDAPRWRQDCEQAFGEVDEASYMAGRADPARADIGVFNGKLLAVVSLVRHGPGLFEVHLQASRSTDLAAVLWAIEQLRAQLQFTCIFCWLPFCNRAILRLLTVAGFRPDGMTVFAGLTHGRPIEWHRLVLQ